MLLVALALAAATGALAVFIDAPWVTRRVMWTGIITAVASGITLLFAMMLDRKKTRLAGLFGLSWLVTLYLLTVGLVWLERALSSRVEEEVGLTILILLVTGLLVLVSLVLVGLSAARAAGFAGVLVSIVTLLLLLLAIWLPGSWWSNDEWAVSGRVVFMLGIIGVVTLIGVEANRWWWRWVGLALGTIGLVLALADIWDKPLVPEEIVSPFITGAALLAFTNAIFLIRLRPGQRWLRWVVFVAAVGTTIAFNVVVITEEFMHMRGASTNFFERSSIAGAIVTGCGTMALAVLAIFNRRADAENAPAEFGRLQITCPRCRTSAAAPIGKSRCPGCGLRFDLRIEEPRCVECGYLLWGVEANRCPECGTEMAAGNAPPEPPPGLLARE